MLNILKRRKKTLPAPIPMEDDFLTKVRCAVHDWDPVVDEQLRQEKLLRKAKKKLRHKRT